MVTLRSGATPHKASSASTSYSDDTSTPQRRGRGRPRKSIASPGELSEDDDYSSSIASRKTPRVKREPVDDFDTPSVMSDSGKRGRGRPRKSLLPRDDESVDIKSEPGTAVERGKGRPSILATKGIDEMIMSPKPSRELRSLGALKFESEEEDTKPARKLRSAGSVDDGTAAAPQQPKTPKSPRGTKIKKETPRSPKDDFPDMLTDMRDANAPDGGTIVVTQTGDESETQTIRRELILFPIVFCLILAAAAYFGVLDIVVNNAKKQWHNVLAKTQELAAGRGTGANSPHFENKPSSAEFDPLP